MIRYSTLLIIIMMFGLMACTRDPRTQQNSKTVAQIKARTPRTIEPLPIISPMAKTTYQAHNLRDPFSPPYKKKVAQQQPNLARPKEVLEAFPLDSLKMMGTIEQNGRIWALIKEPNGAIHPVTIGNYIGQHFGRITKITHQETALIESVKQGNRWEKRKASLAVNKDS